jgi:predicted N-formylglutamate amidohydrolase
MDRHAEAAHIPYLGFEIRQDLIADDAGADRYAAIVARTILTTLEGL